MKKFLKYLAIGLSVAILVSVGICYFVWSSQSVHRLIWLGIVFVIGIMIRYYIGHPGITADYVNGGLAVRKMTKWEQVGVIVRICVGTVILGALIWTIGYGVACQFEWNPPYWEVYLLYGVGTIAAVFGTIGIFALTFYLVKYFDWNSPKLQAAITLGKNVLMWIVIIGCSLAVAFAIFEYLLPLALDKSG